MDPVLESCLKQQAADIARIMEDIKKRYPRVVTVGAGAGENNINDYIKEASQK